MCCRARSQTARALPVVQEGVRALQRLRAWKVEAVEPFQALASDWSWAEALRQPQSRRSATSIKQQRRVAAGRRPIHSCSIAVSAGVAQMGPAWDAQRERFEAAARAAGGAARASPLMPTKAQTR